MKRRSKGGVSWRGGAAGAYGLLAAAGHIEKNDAAIHAVHYSGRTTSWSITTQIKQEGTFLNVGEPETATNLSMLYEIRGTDEEFQLFFRKKNGLKFKKAYKRHKREWVELMAQRYLTHCCLRCLRQGWVYKMRGSGGISGGGASHGKGNRGAPRWGNPPAGTIVSCPECRARHRIQYEEGRRMVLQLIEPEA